MPVVGKSSTSPFICRPNRKHTLAILRFLGEQLVATTQLLQDDGTAPAAPWVGLLRAQALFCKESFSKVALVRSMLADVDWARGGAASPDMAREPQGDASDCCHRQLMVRCWPGTPLARY